MQRTACYILTLDNSSTRVYLIMLAEVPVTLSLIDFSIRMSICSWIVGSLPRIFSSSSVHFLIALMAISFDFFAMHDKTFSPIKMLLLFN